MHPSGRVRRLPEVRPTLAKLSQYKLAILSNGSPKTLAAALFIIRSLSKLALLTSTLAFASDTERSKATTIVAPGGRIDVFAAREEVAVAHEDLIGSVSAAS